MEDEGAAFFFGALFGLFMAGAITFGIMAGNYNNGYCAALGGTAASVDGKHVCVIDNRVTPIP